MNEIIIGWVHTNLEALEYRPFCEYYSFSRKGKLLYIGIAYKQDVRTEIVQTLKRLQISTNGLTIWVGSIASSSYERITEQIVRDVECLLIFTHQPSLNTQCTETYSGRDNLRVRSRGHSIIAICVKVESKKTYRTC